VGQVPLGEIGLKISYALGRFRHCHYSLNEPSIANR
jgi:hypothetical protein